MIREKLVILGGTGSGIIVADAAKVSTRAFDVIGFLNDREPRGSSFSGTPVLGSFESWSDYACRDAFHQRISEGQGSICSLRAACFIGNPGRSLGNRYSPRRAGRPRR